MGHGRGVNPQGVEAGPNALEVFRVKPKAEPRYSALVLVHLQSFSENLLLQFVVSVQEVEHVLDEPSELKTKAAFVLHFRYTFAL